MGYYRLLYNLFEPLVEVLRPIPGPAYLPILVLFVGIGHEMKVTLIFLASLFPILLNTYSGVRSIDRVQFDTARTLGLRPPTGKGWRPVEERQPRARVLVTWPTTAPVIGGRQRSGG